MVPWDAFQSHPGAFSKYRCWFHLHYIEPGKSWTPSGMWKSRMPTLRLGTTLLDSFGFPGLFWRQPCGGYRYISVISEVIDSVKFGGAKCLQGFPTFTPNPTPGVPDGGLLGCLWTEKGAFIVGSHFGMGVPCWSVPQQKPQGSSTLCFPPKGWELQPCKGPHCKEIPLLKKPKSRKAETFKHIHFSPTLDTHSHISAWSEELGTACLILTPHDWQSLTLHCLPIRCDVNFSSQKRLFPQILKSHLYYFGFPNRLQIP